MINKYQQGGILQKIQAMPEQQKKAFLEQFAQWAQANGMDIQQLSQDPQALEQAMTAFVQAMQGGQQAVTARLGAKLNYIRSLKGECPEGQEVKYFKEGGQMKCKCVDKAAGGEKVKAGKEVIADFKKKKACKGMKAKKKQEGGELEEEGQSKNWYQQGFDQGFNLFKKNTNDSEEGEDEEVVTEKSGGKTKKACGGSRLSKKVRAKFQPGGKTQKPKNTEKPKYTKDQLAGRAPVKVVNGVKYFLNGDGQVVKDPKGKNSGSWTQKDDDKMLKYRLKGTKTPAEKRDSTENQMKWNNLSEAEKKKHEVQEQKCGGKAKKHQHGGSLNGIPFTNLGLR